MCFSVGLVPYVPLGFERAQYGQHRGIRKRIGKLPPHLGHRAGALLPQYGHHIELTAGECHVVHIVSY